MLFSFSLWNDSTFCLIVWKRVRKRPRDVSCLSVVSFNSTKRQQLSLSFCRKVKWGSCSIRVYCEIPWCVYKQQNQLCWSFCNTKKIFGCFNNIMSVLGCGRDEMLAVFLAKTYCLPILLYRCETWRMSSSDKHKVDVAWNNCFRKIFNACWRESAKPLLFYCGTMPVSLLVDQRKMIFYNKTLHSSNTVLRVVCRLHLWGPETVFSLSCFSRAYWQRRY